MATLPSPDPMRTSPLMLLPLLAATACVTSTAWNDVEQQQFVAMQLAVNAQLAAGDAALLQEAAIELPAGHDLDDVDEFLNVLPPLPSTPGALATGAGPTSKCRLPGRVIYTESGTTVSFAGHTLAPFDRLDDVALQPERGIVLLGKRHGVQTITTASTVWSGELWREDLAPSLSTDGSCFVYVEPGFWASRSMIAATSDPMHGRPLLLGGRIHWPVWPGRDGKRVRAIVENEGRIEIHDGPNVIAIAEDYAHPFFDAERDQLRLHLISGGKTRMLIDDRLTPPLDSYRWLEQSTDGKRYAAVGRDGDVDHLVVDGNSVLQHARIVALALASDGSTWACAVQEGEQCFVVRPDGRTGPFGAISQLVLAPDGGSLAIRATTAGTGQWLIDGAPLSGYEAVRDLRMLPNGGGPVFVGRDAQGWWVVALGRGDAGGKDGPWDEVGRCWLDVGGEHVLALTRRGQQAHRRVLSLR